MLNEELKASISNIDETVSFDETGEWLTVMVNPGGLNSLAKGLRYDEALFFDYLFCLTCIDWKTNLTMVYHFSSTRHRHNIVVKSVLDIKDPQIETLTHIWRTAEFHEREVYEMFGVHFINHPDLRLLILPDGWEGKNPMLKDFEDPVNMIKL